MVDAAKDTLECDLRAVLGVRATHRIHERLRRLRSVLDRFQGMVSSHERPALPNAAETPIETYAREGKLMTGCLWGSSYETKVVPKNNGKKGTKIYKLDAQGQKILLIKCGKLCAMGSNFCPKHQLQADMKEAKKHVV